MSTREMGEERARELPLLNVKKKRDYPQSTSKQSKVSKGLTLRRQTAQNDCQKVPRHFKSNYFEFLNE